MVQLRPWRRPACLDALVYACISLLIISVCAAGQPQAALEEADVKLLSEADVNMLPGGDAKLLSEADVKLLSEADVKLQSETEPQPPAPDALGEKSERAGEVSMNEAPGGKEAGVSRGRRILKVVLTVLLFAASAWYALVSARAKSGELEGEEEPETDPLVHTMEEKLKKAPSLVRRMVIDCVEHRFELLKALRNFAVAFPQVAQEIKDVTGTVENTGKPLTDTLMELSSTLERLKSISGLGKEHSSSALQAVHEALELAEKDRASILSSLNLQALVEKLPEAQEKYAQVAALMETAKKVGHKQAQGLLERAQNALQELDSVRKETKSSLGTKASSFKSAASHVTKLVTVIPDMLNMLQQVDSMLDQARSLLS